MNSFKSGSGRSMSVHPRTAKLFRKVRVSASIDKDALRLLERIANDERRNISNALNTIIYEAAASRGLEPRERGQK